MPWVKPVRSWLNAPAAVPPWAAMLPVGFVAVPQTVPRAVIGTPPVAEIVAPSVASVWSMPVAVGDVSVGVVTIVRALPAAVPYSAAVVVASLALAMPPMNVRPAVGAAATLPMTR